MGKPDMMGSGERELHFTEDLWLGRGKTESAP